MDYKRNNIWYYLLGILGFQSCVNFGGTEYGTPHATFNIDGTVLDAKTEQPVRDIKVIMKKNYEHSDTLYVVALDSVRSDSVGRFVLNYTDFPSDQIYVLEFIDDDGIMNGEYESKQREVIFEDPKFEGGNKSWFSGQTSKNISVRMNPKADEE